MSAVACVLGHTGSERAEGGGSSGAEGRRGLMVMLHSRLRHGSDFSAHALPPPPPPVPYGMDGVGPYTWWGGCGVSRAGGATRRRVHPSLPVPYITSLLHSYLPLSYSSYFLLLGGRGTRGGCPVGGLS